MSDELMKRLQKGRENAADRIEALTTMVEQLGREVNVARYGQPDFAWSIHKAAMADLQAERDRLRAALGEFVAHYPKGINPDLDAACSAARAALKGETP